MPPPNTPRVADAQPAPLPPTIKSPKSVAFPVDVIEIELITLELVPSLFTQTRIRRRQKGKEQIFDDADISNAIGKLRNKDAKNSF